MRAFVIYRNVKRYVYHHSQGTPFVHFTYLGEYYRNSTISDDESDALAWKNELIEI